MPGPAAAAALPMAASLVPSLASSGPAGMGVGGAIAVGSALDALIRGKQEKKIRRAQAAAESQLKSGQGISKGGRDAIVASGNQAIDAHQQQLIAQANRGGVGADSGRRQANLRDVFAGAAGARKSLTSDALRASRAELDALRARVEAGRAELAALNQSQIDTAVGAVGSLLGGAIQQDQATGFAKGQEKRMLDPIPVEDELDEILSSSAFSSRPR